MQAIIAQSVLCFEEMETTLPRRREGKPPRQLAFGFGSRGGGAAEGRGKGADQTEFFASSPCSRLHFQLSIP